VVATAVGGIPEQIEDGRTGLLVPAGDAEGMAEAICALLCDEEVRTHMSRRGAVAGRRCFHPQHQVEKYLKWYEEILEEWH